MMLPPWATSGFCKKARGTHRKALSFKSYRGVLEVMRVNRTQMHAIIAMVVWKRYFVNKASTLLE